MSSSLAHRAFAKLGVLACTIPKGGVTQDTYAQVRCSTSAEGVTPEGLQPPPCTWEEYALALKDVEAELAMAALRKERNNRLTASDYAMFPDVQVHKEAWAAYRQALRDLPETANPLLVSGTERLDISSVDWPVPPTGQFQ